MDLGLKGKKAVVLGGTRGIGRAIADTFAAEGVNVAICARNADQVKDAVAALKDKRVNAIGASVDIANGEALKKWVDEAGKALGGIDILISNASALSMGNDEKSWEGCFRVDVMGAVNSFEAAKPYLEKSASANGDASVVLISSVSAAETSSTGAYGPMKAAMIHFAKGAAKQYAPKKIRVNVVSPGTIYFKGGVWNMVEQGNPEMFKGTMARNPLGRMGTPQEIANAAVFLASPVSGFTTGANLIADGAITGRVNF
jgi:3-oxoacyl-[acyl-carrier protein] reductase